LQARNIQQELAVKAMNNDKLAPLLSLMVANEQEHSNTSEAAQTALNDIKTINSSIPQPEPDRFQTNTAAFSLIPDAEQLGIFEVTVKHGSLPFNNWGQTVENRPNHTLVVRKIAGVQALVQWAGKENKRIRMSGFRHTWT
jgi:hypothetical protein